MSLSMAGLQGGGLQRASELARLDFVEPRCDTLLSEQPEIITRIQWGLAS